MECVFGLVGDAFALIVEDTSSLQSIIVQKTNEDKILNLDSHKLLGATGEHGDRFCSVPFLSFPSLFGILGFFSALSIRSYTQLMDCDCVFSFTV